MKVFSRFSPHCEGWLGWGLTGRRWATVHFCVLSPSHYQGKRQTPSNVCRKGVLGCLCVALSDQCLSAMLAAAHQCPISAGLRLQPRSKASGVLSSHTLGDPRVLRTGNTLGLTSLSQSGQGLCDSQAFSSLFSTPCILCWPLPSKHS